MILKSMTHPLCILFLGAMECFQLLSAQNSSYIAVELSKAALDETLTTINESDLLKRYVVPTNESRTFSLGNFTLPAPSGSNQTGAELYNVQCQLYNVSDIYFTSEFYDADDNIGISANNVSAICGGLYNYTIEIFGSQTSINDTWNMTISNASLLLIFGIRLQSSPYFNQLPNITYIGSNLTQSSVQLNVNGQLAETFGSIILPDEESLKVIVNETLVNQTNQIVPPLLIPLNELIVENLARLNLTSLITYQPDMFVLPPDVTNNSLRLYFRGDIFLAPVGFQDVKYPEINMTFSPLLGNASQTEDHDVQILISPTFIRTAFYYLIQQLNYIDNLSEQLAGTISISQARIDKIIPTLNDPMALEVTPINNTTLRVSLYNYSLELQGQFINTRFDYRFTLKCDFPTRANDLTYADIQFYSIVNNHSQLMPQVNIQNVQFPLDRDQCKLDVQGGFLSQIIEKYVRSFQLPSAIQSLQLTMSSTIPRTVTNLINEKIASFYKPIQINISGILPNATNAPQVYLNYTMQGPVSVRGEEFGSVQIDLVTDVVIPSQ
ncbi:hypothetical protein FGO68_gene9674 [Halteria grandinella]|uniref:Lipid-binding serum glycoprotein C-terminal domain-containing protein n=1 Tax=Halteria grandinella TaxID=5974 RepID=A0A8J8NRI5_HALGN|nr:hypothetical protein FGO68_gene9674 [Halteria grandinella]